MTYIYTKREYLACVAGVQKGRGRELGRETMREGGGRKGKACKEAIVFAIPPNKNNATVND